MVKVIDLLDNEASLYPGELRWKCSRCGKRNKKKKGIETHIRKGVCRG